MKTFTFFNGMIDFDRHRIIAHKNSDAMAFNNVVKLEKIEATPKFRVHKDVLRYFFKSS
jgi:hypothetical protein